LTKLKDIDRSDAYVCTVSGTPATAGTSNLTVKVTDSGSPNQSVSGNETTDGEGTRGGMGIGSDGGLGPGHGNGVGPGMDHGIGGEIYTPGGGVSKPIPIFTPEAEFSDEARRQKYQGVCMISVIIDSHGIPQDPRVVQHLGMGLDEKALEAVSKYRFKPAMKGGRPVSVRIIVEVDFRLF
jgi:protein TonB